MEERGKMVVKSHLERWGGREGGRAGEQKLELRSGSCSFEHVSWRAELGNGSSQAAGPIES